MLIVTEKYPGELYRAASLALDWIDGTDSHDQAYIVRRLEDALKNTTIKEK